ncbi:MAG: alpha/beta fold hydrolase [Proteobacteria bacterium]|nr:alpha/beta fold hydrolase [Pseudomonadota bacterium]
MPSLQSSRCVLGFLVGAVVAVAGATIAQAAAPTAVSVSFGSLAFTPCTLAQAGQAQTVPARCATLRVPEDRASKDGRTIELALAWVPSSAKSPARDPVVMLAGGPGQSALDAFPTVYPAFRDILRQRHVLLVDQRGAGKSSPLQCPVTLNDEALRVLDTASVEEARRLTAACLREIGAKADARAYTTSAYIADLEDVRRALGIARFNLVGVSYGTRVALEYLRRHPASIRTVVLDSVVPPSLALGNEHAKNLEAAVNAQFARCAADAECAQRFGSPRARLDELLQRLREQPQKVAYRDPLTNEQREDEVTDATLAAVVRFHAYAPQLFGMLPMLLAEAAGGRYENLMAQSRMLEQLIGEQIHVPLQLSVMCAEDAPGMRVDPADAGTILGTEFVDYTLAQCAVWPRGTMPKDFHDAVKSDHPVLLLSGELDPVTPPRYADEVQRTLPNSRHFVFRGQGHSVLGVGCGPRLVAEFIAAADAKALDGGCLDQLQYSPPFGGSYGWDP